MADPAKALLDLVYFTPKGETLEYLGSLRMEGIEVLEEEDLRRHARRWNRKKIKRAVENILRLKKETIPGRGAQA